MSNMVSFKEIELKFLHNVMQQVIDDRNKAMIDKEIATSIILKIKKAQRT